MGALEASGARPGRWVSYRSGPGGKDHHPLPRRRLYQRVTGANYRASRLPGHRPFTTTPTIPSTIATITSSRKKASIRSSAQSGRSAAGQPPLTAAARLICQAIVLKDRLFVARRQLAVSADRRGILHLLPVIGDLEVPRALSRSNIRLVV